MQSFAEESTVYFTPQSIAASERLKASDRFFCVMKRYGFHVCMCGVFDVCSRDRDSPAHNESGFFLASCVSHPSCHCMVCVKLQQHRRLKSKYSSLNGKSSAFRKLMNKWFIQWFAVILLAESRGYNYLGHSLFSLSTENPWGQVFNGLITMACVKGDNKYGWFPANDMLSFYYYVGWRCVITSYRVGQLALFNISGKARQWSMTMI